MGELIYLGLFGAAILFLGIQSYLSGKRERENVRKKIKRNWGNIPERDYDAEQMNNITHYFRYRQKPEYFVDDITWNDLNMDHIFMLINNTYSSVGEEYLYRMLREPVQDEKKLKENDVFVSWFEKNPKEAQRFQEIYEGLGRTHFISMYDYLYTLKDLGKRSSFKHYLAIILFCISVGVFIVSPPVGILMAVFMLGSNVISYFVEKAKIENYFQCFQYLAKMIATGERICKRERAEELSPLANDIEQPMKALKNIRKGIFLIAGNKMAGSLGDIVMDYIRMLFHVDLIKFNQMINLASDKKNEIDRLFEGLGRFEACIATASFRTMLSYYCKPEFVEEKRSSLSFEEMYHPSVEHAIANDLNERRGVLITGSNASGKSTFLKTVAINAILAQTIYTCAAERYRGNYFEIYSSMALRDDLDSRESYYIVEIKSLKRIVDKAKTACHILCCIDEVLRGTNTIERIAASAHILKSLAVPQVLCFAATHDIELTHILEDYYSNYHFQEEVEDNDIIFNYKLYEGRANSRNAIKLLGIIGYDESIIKEAEHTAEAFLQNGVWTKCY